MNRKITAAALLLVISLVTLTATQTERKKVVCWGDSLTAPHPGCYPDALATALGSAYEVINCGVGGENTVTIMSRQGAYPMVLAHDVNIYRDSERRFPVFVGNCDVTAFESSYNGSKVTPLIQGGWEEGKSAAWVNPVIIDGREFDIRSEAHFWGENGFKFEYNHYLQPRAAVDSSFVLRKGAVIETKAMRELRGAYANVFFVGQNAGFSTVEDYISQIKAMIAYSGCERYVVVSFHKPNWVVPLEKMPQMEAALKAEFGRHYIALRDYLVRDGLKDAGLKPSEKDAEAVANGEVPPQLMTDGCHFTDAGYALIAAQVAQRFKKLGY